MEIQKIFSNTEDENEKLYSVLMTQDEVALYSEFQERLYAEETKKQKRNRKIAAAAVTGTGTLIGGLGGFGSALNDDSKYLDKLTSLRNRVESQNGDILNRAGNVSSQVMQRGFKDQKAKDAYDQVMKKAEHYVNTNAKRVKRAFKVYEGMSKKNAVKKSLKGAAIGTALLAPIAYSGYKSQKKANDRKKKK